MFSKSAKYYNAIYSSLGKDYVSEAQKVHELIQAHKKSPGNMLLDVACGTGLHASHLSKYFQVEGLDLDPEILAVARENNPDIKFHQADMTNFDLGREFDAVTCLFSSIGYVRTLSRMQQAIQTMTRHLEAGGVLLVEPWFTPEQWHPGHVGSIMVEQPDFKVVRMSLGSTKNGLSILDFHYLIGTSQGIEYFTERHELGLFTHDEYSEAFRLAGLKVLHDPEGLYGRGLYIGIKPIS